MATKCSLISYIVASSEDYYSIKKGKEDEREGCFTCPDASHHWREVPYEGEDAQGHGFLVRAWFPSITKSSNPEFTFNWVLFLRKSRSISGIIYNNLILSNKKTQGMTEEPCSLMALQERGDDIMRMALHFNLLCTLWLAKLASSTRDKWYYDGDGQKWILRRSSFPFSRSSNGGDSINQ